MKIFFKRTCGSRLALGRALAISFMLLLGGTSMTHAQVRNPKPPSLTPDKAGDEDPDKNLTSLEEEQAAKRALRAADKEYQDNLNRARDLSVLSESIVTSFKEKNLLDREDIKKLERLEKLAKGIRSAAGGSEDDGQMEKPPKDLRAAVDMPGRGPR